MPIYEVHCEKCGQESEILAASSKWQGTPCPKCGSKKLAKKFSVFSASIPTVRAPTACGMKPSRACHGCANHQH